MQEEIIYKVTFYGLKDVVQTISTGYINTFRSAISFLKSQEEIQYKLTRPAYTSKLLVGLLKEEYEVRTFTTGSVITTGTFTYAQLSNLKL